jgi:hypothetical protein
MAEMRVPTTVALLLALDTGCSDQIVGSFEGSADAGAEASTQPEAPLASEDGANVTATATVTDGSFTGSTTDPAPESDDAAGEGTSGRETSSAAIELCDGMDNDGDGLVDEVAADNIRCGTCRLSQGAGQAWWVCDEQLTWELANARCLEFGATAAIPSTEEANAFVLEEFNDTFVFFWLGARDAEVEGQWQWADGTALEGWSNWASTQPDDFEAAQDCMRLTFGITGEGWFDGSWDDFYCDQPNHVLCSAAHEL